MFFYAGCAGLAMNIIYCGKDSRTGKALLWIAGGFLILIGIIIGLFLFIYTTPGPYFYNWFPIPVPITFSEFFLTFSGSFGLFFLGFVLIVLNIYTFGMRRTYVEESSGIIFRL